MDRRGRAAAVVLALVASALAPAAAAAPTAPRSDPLRALAARAGLRIGATLEPGQIADPQHSGILAREFSSVTPENAMKWYAVEPQRDQVDYAGADAVVAFAEANDLEVRGHNLVWAQDRYTPAWVVALTDPDELRAELAEHVRGLLERYRGRVHRWDVVNEPLETAGTATSGSVFERVLGPSWIADTFRLAHEVDPTAELWLNEYGTDLGPLKHEALLALVRDLLAEGCPSTGSASRPTAPRPTGPTGRGSKPSSSSSPTSAWPWPSPSSTSPPIPTTPTPSDARPRPIARS
ncbi:MAG: endo-1,4-beta-xylanase [Acidimicrobiales bacterium]